MKNYAFIWDLDGTLLDSYGVIVASLYETLIEFEIEMPREDILRYVIRYSVRAFLAEIEKKFGVPSDVIQAGYSARSRAKKLEIRPVANGAEILAYLCSQKIPNFVFTHRGASTEAVLKNTGLYGFFTEIVTSQEGFARKPSPDGINYLLKKHRLDKNDTFYVGDRTLDMECARNAGIRSILYLPKGGAGQTTGIENHVIQDLLEIKAFL